MDRITKACLVSLLALTLSADEVPETQQGFTPWFTGPIVAPIGLTVPLGDFEMDNYVNFQTITGAYDGDWNEEGSPNFYSLNPQLLYYFGLTPWMDLQIVPSYFYQFTEGEQSFQFGDFFAALDFQLYNNDNYWFPAIKLSVGETLPTGTYEHLSPSKLFTDSSGNGTFSTTFSLVLFKIYQLGGEHALSFTFANSYSLNTPVSVKGFNTYGGGYGTHGEVKGGDTFQSILSFEYSLNQNWNLALDTVWTHSNALTFSGDPGVDSLGEEASVGSPTSESLSFCPAIEYGFSENLGIVGGCWFSAIGKNSDVFRTASINVYCYF